MVSDNITEMVTALGNALRRKGWTVSSAESCTGGGVAFAFTSIAGSSDWFNQSWVTYSNDAKMRELGVKPETLNAHGAVSMQTVGEMAAAKKSLWVQFGLGLSVVLNQKRLSRFLLETERLFVCMQ